MRNGSAGSCSMTSAPGAGELSTPGEKGAGDEWGGPELAQGPLGGIASAMPTWRSSPVSQGSGRGQPPDQPITRAVWRAHWPAARPGKRRSPCTGGDLPAKTRVVGASANRPAPGRAPGQALSGPQQWPLRWPSECRAVNFAGLRPGPVPQGLSQGRDQRNQAFAMAGREAPCCR